MNWWSQWEKSAWMSKNGSKIQSRIQGLKSKSDSMEKLAFDGFKFVPSFWLAKTISKLAFISWLIVIKLAIIKIRSRNPFWDKSSHSESGIHGPPIRDQPVLVRGSLLWITIPKSIHHSPSRFQIPSSFLFLQNIFRLRLKIFSVFSSGQIDRIVKYYLNINRPCEINEKPL